MDTLKQGEGSLILLILLRFLVRGGAVVTFSYDMDTHFDMIEKHVCKQHERYGKLPKSCKSHSDSQFWW